MPDWTPNWSDVNFDHAAADRAATECDAVATRLRDSVGERQRLATTARDQWAGRYRDDFDTAFAARIGDSGRLEADLRALARRIREAAAAAGAEQARREGDRTRWRSEQRAEDHAACRPGAPC